MSAIDKIKDKVGELTDNDQLQAQGKKDQTTSSLKDAGESIKDAVTK
jgi:uncharacterized protein YjbJ (UPF0337 family)